MEEPRKILVIEGARHDFRITCELLEQGGDCLFEPIWMESLHSGLEFLKSNIVDAVLVDFRLPDSDGLDTFLKISAHAPGTAIILMTGLDYEHLAVDAIKRGAQDCLIKGELGGTELLTAVVNGIARQKIRNSLKLQSAVTAILDEEETMKDAACRILQSVGEILGWDCGLFWVIDEQERLLRCEDYWELPLLELPEFESMSRATSFSSGISLPGRVWATGMPVWVADLACETAPGCRSEAVQKAGLKSAFGFPILFHRKVVGVLEFFSRAGRDYDQDAAASLAAIGSQIGQSISRKETEKKLAEQESLLRSVLDAIPEGVVVADRNMRLVIFNPAAQRMVGIGKVDSGPAEWPETYGIYHCDLVSLYKPEELPLVRALHGQPVDSEELFIRNGENAGMWACVSARPVLDADGRPNGAVLIFRDVTQSRLSEQLRMQWLDPVEDDGQSVMIERIRAFVEDSGFLS